MCETYVVQGLCPPAKKKALSEFLPRVASGGWGVHGGGPKGPHTRIGFSRRKGAFFWLRPAGASFLLREKYFTTALKMGATIFHFFWGGGRSNM